MTITDDQSWMLHCLQLAQTAQGRTAPNPLVGCVVVAEGNCIGSGFHPRAGQPHAEIFALHQAAEQARGATLYVNLEPCNHRGRTAPCTEAIIRSGLARVVVGMIDPNPLVAGQGIRRLQAAGIAVTTGVLEAACQQLNEAFCHYMLTGKPFGIWKYAMTLDGKIATATGDSFWVSGEAAREQVHRLRNQVDGIIIGGQTVRQDNPHLTCRLVNGRNPLRIVLSRQLDLPDQAHLWQVEAAPTLVFTSTNHNVATAKALTAQGVEICALEKLTPEQVLIELGHRGLLSVLWECGGTLAAAALDQRAIQKVMAFVSPKLVGGAHAATPLGGQGQSLMRDAFNLHNLTMSQVGNDYLIEGYLQDIKST